MADSSAALQPAVSLPLGHADPAPALAAAPSSSVPLVFLAAAAAGLAACGAALIWSSGVAVPDPTADPVVAAVHLGVLATLSTGVLGALHHFVPLLTHRRLRSPRLAWATFATWVAAAWLLPLGVATANETLVEVGGALAVLAVVLVAIDLSGPLGLSGGGVSLVGVRLALVGFAATVAYGAGYVADRRGGWFVLSGHTVLAHAVVGLFAWLGLTYIAVAEKLWPMFLLARAPNGRLAPRLAAGAVPAGVALLSPGLLTGVAPLASIGAGVLTVGLAAHLASMATHVRHRRRGASVELLFVVTSALCLVAAAGLGLTAVLVMPASPRLGEALVAAAVAAACGWLLEALVGLAHKVSAFILWPELRTRGAVHGPAGRPLQFSDLYDRRLAGFSWAALSAGIGAICAGLATSSTTAIGTGGALLTTTAAVTAANLALTPARRLRASGRDAPPAVRGAAMAVVDARPLIAQGLEPFATVMEAVSQLVAGEELVVLAPFEPVPLEGVLSAQGFTAEAVELEGGDWRVIFRRG